MERFAFVFHPLRLSDFARKFPLVARLPERLVEESFKYVPPFTVSHITGVRSPTGAAAEGWFIALPMTPRVLQERPFAWVLPRLVAAVRKGEEKGARIVGLGAFTKVVGDRGVSVARAVDVAVTTGNSYTAASAVEGAVQAARRLGYEPGAVTASVIGATGAIGRAVSWLLAPDVGRLLLVARSRDRLEELAGEIRGAYGEARVEVSTDVTDAVRRSELVLTVSSSTDVLIEPGDIRRGAVVCDVSRPRNVSARVYEERDDVLVIDGGVIAVPGPVDFGFDFGFPPRTAEACMAETMILALEGRYEDYTLGADIPVERVREIAALAKKHGFQVAGFRRFERAIADEEVERIRERASLAS